MVRRHRQHSIHYYIRMRVEQLKLEATKCNDSRDRQWYLRLAQELEWCLLYKQSEEDLQ